MFPERLEGIVFDLDATLVNMGGFVNWREAQKRAKETYIRCKCSEDMIQQFSERGLFNMLNLVRDENMVSMSPRLVEDIQREVYEVIEVCEMESVDLCELMPGCDSTLQWLKNRGVKMGIATSNSETVAHGILKGKRIDHYFTSVVGRRPELKMKPNPDQLLECLKEMGVKPENGIMIGDSPKDVGAAKAAGMFVIAIPAYFTRRESLNEAGVDLIIEGLEELPRFIPEESLGKASN